MLSRRAVMPLLAVLPLLAFTPGCVTRPTMSVHHAEVRGVSSYGVQVMIFLQVRNDNSYDIQIRHVNCNVTLGRGYVLGPIDFAPNTWLPSNNTTFLGVPMTIPWSLMPALALETYGSFAIPYVVKGSADVTATRSLGIEKDNYPIDQAGMVPRQMVIDAARSVMPFAM